MKMVEYGKPVYLANGEEYEVIRPNQIKVCGDGALVGNAYLSNEVIENLADKLIESGDKDVATDIKYIPPFPENCPIDPKHHATGPAMDLNGEIKNVDVYRKADDEDIAVVPNGIIHDGEFINTRQIAEAAMIGCELTKLYRQETGKGTEVPKLNTPLVPSVFVPMCKD